MEFLQNIWYILIGVLLIGYSILDGFDLGVGTLLPFLAKKKDEKRVLFNAIGPFWDGNEVWLITGGGALFAAFPLAYATVFSGFYLALMLVLFALIFRAVSLEFWSHDKKRRKLWKWTFIIGSFLPSLLYGELQEKAHMTTKKLIPLFVIFLILAFTANIVYIPFAISNVLAWIFTILVTLGLIILWSALRKGKESVAFYEEE